MFRPNDKPVLLLDQDEPLSGWNDAWWDLVERFKFDTSGFDRTNFTARYATDHLSARDADIMEWIVDNSNWYESLPVVPGAKEGVAELMEHFDVYVCTKPAVDNKTCYQGKASWISRHFPELSERLFITPDKGRMNGDILLDDAPPVEWLGKSSWRPVVFSKPFNGAGSAWADLPRWTWGDGVEKLLELVGDD